MSSAYPAQVSEKVQQSKLLIDEPSEGIQRWVLNRPNSYNALDLDMIEAMFAQIERLKARHDIRVIIIQGNGRGFSAGHDLKELAGIDDPAVHDIGFRQMTRIAVKLQRMHQVVIAVVHGTAAAAGCLLAASCDLILAEESASFSVPGINVGLFCFTPMLGLYQHLPDKILLDMLLTGRKLSAEEARSFGLIARMIEDKSHATAGLEFAQMIAKNHSKSLSDGKRGFYQLRHGDLEENFSTATELMVRHFNTPATQGLVKAFIDKTNPSA